MVERIRKTMTKRKTKLWKCCIYTVTGGGGGGGEFFSYKT